MLISIQIFALLFLIAGAQRECDHGSQSICDQNGCHWCPCTEICVADEFAFGCQYGCVGFCNDIYMCAENGCIYDYEQNKCLDYFKDKNKVSFTAVCNNDANNENETRCTSAGCIYCKCEKKCKHPSERFDCDTKCDQYCGIENDVECAAHGCLNYKGACWSTNNDFRYSTNLCYFAHSTVHNVYYQGHDTSKVKFLDNTVKDECFCTSKYGRNWTHAELELWTCTLIAPDMVLTIPIREAGAHDIGLQLIENFMSFGRTQTAYLNEIPILKDFNLDSIGPIGTTTNITTQFEVNCDMNEITIDGITKPILNTNLELHLIGDDKRKNRGAILNGYFVQKLDDTT